MVVTGTAAESRKKELGNSMAAIGTTQLADAPVVNIQEALGARAALDPATVDLRAEPISFTFGPSEMAADVEERQDRLLAARDRPRT